MYNKRTSNIEMDQLFKYTGSAVFKFLLNIYIGGKLELIIKVENAFSIMQTIFNVNIFKNKINE